MYLDKSQGKPPGKKLISNMSSHTKWMILAPISLLLIGYGLCVFSEAGHYKHTGNPTHEWVLLGTYSLILINGGLSLFGQAVRYRILIDVRRETRRSLRKLETKLSKKVTQQSAKPGKRKSPTKTN